MKKSQDAFGNLTVAGLRTESVSDGRRVASHRQLREEQRTSVEHGDKQAVADLGRGQQLGSGSSRSCEFEIDWLI